MQRTLEPELMNDPEQAAAYAGHALDNAGWLFTQCFRKYFRKLHPRSTILDLGCGPAGIPLRLARLFPDCRIHGVDGAADMLALGQAAIIREGKEQQIQLFQGIIPNTLPLPQRGYDIIIANSFLHHLADPMSLWQTIRAYGMPGATVLIVDLLRPANHQEAELVVDRYVSDAPPMLRRDMLLSLHAAFTLEEIREQLDQVQIFADFTLNRAATPFQFALYGHLKMDSSPAATGNVHQTDPEGIA